MANLADRANNALIKLLLIGDSGTGKTGALASLVAAGYKLNIIDMDNGLTALVQYAKNANSDLSLVDYNTYRDQYRSTKAGPMIKGSPKAFNDAMDKLTQWSEIDDPMSITVLDSLTFLGKAAMAWAAGMNPTTKDPRQWFYTSQKAIENVLALLTDDAYKQNVIVISHVNYKEVTENNHKGYPSAIGSALGPTIASYFDIMVLAESSGSGTNVRRKIKTLPTGVIDLKMPNPKIEKELPLETGLATIFSELKT